MAESLIKISSLLVLSSEEVKVTFTGGLAKDVNLYAPANYAFKITLGAGEPVYVKSVTPEDVASPTFVVLELRTPLSWRGLYRLAVRGPLDPGGNVVVDV